MSTPPAAATPVAADKIVTELKGRSYQLIVGDEHESVEVQSMKKLFGKIVKVRSSLYRRAADYDLNFHIDRSNKYA
jgi:hypothetical protein